MTKGYVYVIEDEPDICKIGFSKTFPTNRQKQISCAYHKDLKLVGVFKSDTAVLDEKEIHKKLEKYRIRGEWFKLSFEEIKQKLSFNFITLSELESLENKKEKEWMHFLLRIKTEAMEKIDEEIKDRMGMTRTAWILETIQERLRK